MSPPSSKQRSRQVSFMDNCLLRHIVKPYIRQLTNAPLIRSKVAYYFVVLL